MITIFTTAKPFCGHSGMIQRNALESWNRLHADAEVILFGDEEGAAEAARELGIKHVADVKRVESGPKILPSFFDAAQRMARHELICYANCDIVLMEDFAAAVVRIAETEKNFLMVGRRWDTDVREPVDFTAADWKTNLRERS